ncbi:HAD family hydrolase [Rhodoferax sp. U11-2br]|uniref:HAD-IIIC family phosphatase n=1 Tax=Rhodoferax sp. U11-2br TaxID=2838878 RepID=UPI001BED2C17|nr:HAD-IIIC family phosphatase [Rhodoferax sp. U11-2br]MBT3068517.1 HAD-IIIC family phosphatase [Rhodoferax sp. U11-2br]
MSQTLYSSLAWLPRPPADFAAKCRALPSSGADLGRGLQALAGYALDENQLIRLSRCMNQLQQQGSSLKPLLPFRLGIVSNATSHFLLSALVATAARHGVALECLEADFDQAMQEALRPDSIINSARPDAVLLAIDYHGLPLRLTPGNAEAAQQTVAEVLEHVDRIRAGFHANSKTVCILQTLARPVETHFGSLDLVLPGTLRSLIDAVNRGLAERVAQSNDLLFDVAGLAETVGLADWHSPTLWNLAKLPFSNTFLPLYADHACRLIAAMRGKSRRCLILDLDNTVWGGVIGDDGLEGIVIGSGDSTGEAHLAVQQTALQLRERGVVLAVSSKNHDETARLPFIRHPEMLLREDHIAIFQANWNDKASNIQAIAEALSLGLDAMTFLDDNPAERGLVRELLPQVAVPELPDDPALYARTLLAGGYFEAVTFSAEDRQRADFYQDNARRIALQQGLGDVHAYLDSLAMVLSIQPFDAIGRSRITQLINKSNQFNLTTRRYSEAEVADLESDPNILAWQMRLADTFGDNGMISVVICRRLRAEWHIDTWLMSCRVLGRGVEEAVLAELVIAALQQGVSRLIGIYLPSGRNQLVEKHYPKLGFKPLDRHPDGSSTWALDIDDAASGGQLLMRVHHVALV